MTNKYTVYRAFSDSSPMSYVGYIEGNLEEAKAYHQVELESGSRDRFYLAMRGSIRVSAVAFQWEVLDVYDNLKDAKVRVTEEKETLGMDSYTFSATKGECAGFIKSTSAALKARKARKPMSEETKRKISEAKKGKSRGSHSRETKMKLSLARIGQKHSEETKQKIAESHLGKKHSIETRRKIAAKTKAYWETRRKAKAIQELVSVSSAPEGPQVTPDAPQIVTEAPIEGKKQFTPPPGLSLFFRGPPRG
jgi:hypothetical protein